MVYIGVYIGTGYMRFILQTRPFILYGTGTGTVGGVCSVIYDGRSYSHVLSVKIIVPSTGGRVDTRQPPTTFLCPEYSYL